MILLFPHPPHTHPPHWLFFVGGGAHYELLFSYGLLKNRTSEQWEEVILSGYNEWIFAK